VLQPIFHGGELRAKRRSAVAAYDQAAAAYREVVLQALQNVADALRALEHDAQALQARADAAAQARYTYETASQQYRVGSASYFSLVDAQRQYEQTMMQQVLAQADRYADSAALVQALGGGWWQHATKMDR
jgi:outer membrane protein TolC